MRFLANENFPLASVRLLREAGHDIAAVLLDSPGAKDVEVLRRAFEQRRVLLTFDRDYGTLIYRFGLPTPAGVLFFRYAPRTPEEPAERMRKLFSAPDLQLEGRFTVLEPGRIRQHSLPSS
jgi:predicted nuclease of predicted toxin-antitoxin system